MAAEVKRIFQDPSIPKNLQEVGAVPSPMTPEQFKEFISAERKKWEEVVKAAKIPQQ